MRHIAVVGASLGGLRTVEALRRQGVEARITLVGAEQELPYDRPPLSKGILLGKVDATAVRLASPDHLDSLDVELRLGTPALGLDVTEHVLTLADGSLTFDDLVIATGAKSRRPAHLGELSGVHVLRTLADALAIRRQLEDGPRVVVIGGGVIGAEVASCARALGLAVTIVELAPVLMQRVLGDLIGARMTELARDAGVRLRLGASVTELVGQTAVEAVRLTDGSTMAADLVVIAVGAAPATDWLAGSGLQIEDGIVCDEYLAAAPGVYAVGDVARWYHPLYGRHVRCEHWSAAPEHAQAVAATLAGTPTVSADIPYVWSDQHGVKIQVAGRLDPADEIRFVIDEPGKFVAVAGSNGEQHAAFALGAPAALIRQRIRLAQRPPWPPPGDG